MVDSQTTMRTHLALTTSIFLCLYHVRVAALATITKYAGPWMARASQLLEFKKKHGHVRVPKRYKEDPGLSNWVNKQRQQYRNFITGQKPCSLTPERIEFLSRLGFSWNGTISGSNESNEKDSDWWMRYSELQKHASSGPKEASASNSPSASSLVATIPRQSPLGKWLQKQRTAKLSAKQLNALDQLDPDWRMAFREFVWEQRYRELQAYEIDHGDCCVPINYSENQPLARWVNRQRTLYNKNRIPPERLHKLNAAGFVWNRWDHEFAKKDMGMNGTR